MNKFQLFNLCKMILLFVLLTFSSCTFTDKKVEYKERSVEEIYNSALNLMNDKNYIDAANEFEEVERQHPYSVWAVQAQIMTAYARYMRNDYGWAISAAERYIELHPSAEDVDYAYYLISISYYERINDVKRDQSMTESALQAFERLIRRFPDSIYSKDSRQKLFLVKDHLAGKDMEVGRTYLRYANHLAAIKRFKNVIDIYPETSHVPEALARLTEVYYMLGIYTEAKAVAAVLGHNYPNNYWHKYTYDLLSDYKERKFVKNTSNSSDNKSDNIGSLSENNDAEDNISLLDEILGFFNTE